MKTDIFKRVAIISLIRCILLNLSHIRIPFSEIRTIFFIKKQSRCKFKDLKHANIYAFVQYNYIEQNKHANIRNIKPKDFTRTFTFLHIQKIIDITEFFQLKNISFSFPDLIPYFEIIFEYDLVFYQSRYEYHN